MAEIKNIGMNKNSIEVRLAINNEEYRVLKHHMSDVIVVPAGKEALTKELTTGKLGNSNRIMVPKKLLEYFGVDKLDKKVASNVYKINGDAYLLIKIRKSRIGIPKFKED
jgi:5-formaminoimidazole-4-carboxamide-1-beta-D-ribofuranosyl 5'-monophosphate synthetase